MPITIRKHGYIDALRGIAVLAVLFDHTGLLGLSPASKVFDFVAAQGARGVQLFYIASALTLFLSLHQRAGREAAPRLDFFLRRFFRIAPLYWLAVAYYLWQNGTGPNYWTGGDRPVALAAVAANLAFVHGAQPYWINSVVPGGWSIGVEMPFYLTVPTLFALYHGRDDKQGFLRMLLLGSLTLSFLLRLALWRHPLIGDPRLWKEYLFLFLPAQFPVFVVGLLAFHTIATGERIDLRLPALGVAAALSANGPVREALGVRLLEPHVAVSFVLGTFVVYLQKLQPRLLVNKALAFVGELSYSLYLTHFMALYLLGKTGLFDGLRARVGAGATAFAAAFAAQLSLALAISWLTNRLVEEPGRELGRRLIERIERARGRAPKARTAAA